MRVRAVVFNKNIIVQRRRVKGTGWNVYRWVTTFPRKPGWYKDLSKWCIREAHHLELVLPRKGEELTEEENNFADVITNRDYPTWADKIKEMLNA